MGDLQECLLQSMDILAEHKIQHSAAAIVIEGSIVAKDENKVGVYKINHKGVIFDAHRALPIYDYAINDNVLILIRDGDFSKKKIILGYADPK